MDMSNLRYVNLATSKRDVTQVQTPVWIVKVDSTAYVYSIGESGKCKRLRNNPIARIAPCSLRGKLLGDWVEVRGSFVQDDALKQRVFAEFRHKYGWQIIFANLLAHVSGRFEKRVVMAFEVI